MKLSFLYGIHEYVRRMPDDLSPKYCSLKNLGSFLYDCLLIVLTSMLDGVAFAHPERNSRSRYLSLHAGHGITYLGITNIPQFLVNRNRCKTLNIAGSGSPGPRLYTEKKTWYKLTHSGESSAFRVIIHK